MLTRICSLFILITFSAMSALPQSSGAEFHKDFREKAGFEESDLASLEQGKSVVKLLPVQDKREVAVCGLVSLQVPAEVFLQSFRDSMLRKNNPAILEIGSFGATPTLDDLQTLTIEDRDIEDLKECVVGNCKLKLSAMMIERFNKEVDWEAAGYKIQAAQLLKLILLEYVRDYLSRGDAALIEYNDKPKEIRLAEEQRSLMAASGVGNDVLKDLPQYPKNSSESELSVVENSIVWSKIKFGLKPVIVLNHILAYKGSQVTGSQIVIVSKQIYANHYFNSSLALTAFLNIPGAGPGSYLYYENRSRADGLEGMFGKLKRGIIEDRAVGGVKAILEQSKARIIRGASSQTEPVIQTADAKRSWRRWTVGGIHLFLWFFLITLLVALYVGASYDWKSGFNRGAQH